MAAKVPKRAPRKKAGYQMPENIRCGEILTDILKKQWVLGKSIGVGGFGEVYSAAPYVEKGPKSYLNVIKIEPHGNGPLFVEMHFYMRNCKQEEIDSWQKKKKLAALGMPRYVASGSHEYKNIKYRFLVIDRYGTDLLKKFEASNKKFPEHTVYKLALQIIDILEYIHHKNYVHADIKSENLLLDTKTCNQVYLVDFGLACRYATSNELKPDQKKAHNGTLPYTSRDAHLGVPTQRGDIEILFYNIIFWLCGSLPWEKILDKVAVQKEKEKAFEKADSFLNKCFHDSVPQTVHEFMNLLSNMKFNETPCYEKLKNTLIVGLKKLGHKPNGKLELKDTSTPSKQNSSKTTPQKVQKFVAEAKKSPYARLLATPGNSLRNNPRDSTVGIVIDKKRGNKRDIKKVLEDIDPDGEYDIKIVQKKTKTKKMESDDKDKKIENATLLNSRKKKRVSYMEDDSESDSEIELSERLQKLRRKKPTASKTTRKVESLDYSDTCDHKIISKKTRGRFATTMEKITTKNISQTNKRIVPKIESDEDIFDNPSS